MTRRWKVSNEIAPRRFESGIDLRNTIASELDCRKAKQPGALMHLSHRVFRAVLTSPFQLVSLLMVVCLAGCSTPNLDELFLRGQYKIDPKVKLWSYWSRPGQASRIFGRENLLIKATFRFTDEQFTEYLKTGIEKNWERLPIADKIYTELIELDRFREADLKRFDAIGFGYYRCETTGGHGIGSGKPLFAFPPKEPDKDFLLGVLDFDKKELHVVLKQDY